MEESVQVEGALSPQRMSRLETALDSERRQREQLERRLREAEERLERALAAVGSATASDPGLFELKAHLAAEAERAEARGKLEDSLHELEFLANVRAQPSTQAPVAPLRTIQYVHVPAPDAEPAKPPKDFDEKLAAAQMAIDAAEARASHNALQVRKLTEELAAARAEQLALAAQMRSLKEQFDSADYTTEAAIEVGEEAAPAPPWEQAPPTEISESLPLSPELPQTADAFDELASALGDWGSEESIDAPAEPEQPVESTPVQSEADYPGLEAALEMFSAPGESAVTQEAQEEAEFEAALEGFGAQEESSAEEFGDLEAALADFGETAPADPTAELVEDDARLELDTVLESFGAAEHHSALDDVESPVADEILIEHEPAESYEAPRYEQESVEYDTSDTLFASLEVDTLERLDTPEAPVEQRVAEALAPDAAVWPVQQVNETEEEVEAGETPMENGLVPTDVWDEPVAVASDENAEQIDLTSEDEISEEEQPSPAEPEFSYPVSTLDQLEEAEAHRAELLATEAYDEPEPVEPEAPAVAAEEEIEEDFVPTPDPDLVIEWDETPAIVDEAPEALEDPADAEALQVAESVAPVEQPPAEDFTPDFGSFMRRNAGGETRPAESGASTSRKSMVNALRRFAGD